MRLRWDIFCTVVDNYGDAGVCWRLARQLVADYGQQVRLWIDDPATLAPLLGEAELLQFGLMQNQAGTTCLGVEIAVWSKDSPLPGDFAVAEVVLEAFACDLPENYLQAMAAAAKPPIWFNLEYLSAEPWVEGCHGGASRHPQFGLTKYFFFPGFTHATGGLLREVGLLEKIAAWQHDVAAQQAFWVRLPGGARPADEWQISLFCYDNAPLARLLAAMLAGEQAIRCLIPPGKPRHLVEHCVHALGFRQVEATPENPNLDYPAWVKGQVTLQTIPFLTQPDYDKLLWSCTANFVRGEDSFVRAQWAAKPLIWQIYPQEEDAHQDKLGAFLALAQLPTAQTALMWAWNFPDDTPLAPIALETAWPHYAKTLNLVQQRAQAWQQELAANGDLARSLVRFVRDLL